MKVGFFNNGSYCFGCLITGGGFATGTIDLGGLQVTEITTFRKIWTTYEVGDNLGATIFEPSPILEGFLLLDCYCQPNNKPLFGSALLAKDVIDGYKAMGHIVTTSSDRPSLEQIWCVQSDLIDECVAYGWIWSSSNGLDIYGTRPTNKGAQALGVSIGTFGGSNDDEYWIDLFKDEVGKEKVMKGDLQTSRAYFHIKPMLGATFADLAIWVFYPFNGPPKAKVGILNSISLGKIREHVDDWEHVTLRISNFNGELRSVYFSQHSGGKWVDASKLGNDLNGIRNDTAKSNKAMDTGTAKVEELLPGKLKSDFEKLIKSLPGEILGEEGSKSEKKLGWG
ncbi:hypothetical protein Ancab_024007 [Ancistrocladus abbreviatus]